MFAFVRLVSNVRRSRVGSNDDEFDDDPEDPDYKEEPDNEPEGKYYRPSLIMLNPEFYKYKTWPTIKPDFLFKCTVRYFGKRNKYFLLNSEYQKFDIKAIPWVLVTLISLLTLG